MQVNKKQYFAYRSFWPEPEAHWKFNKIGVKTVCFFPANTVNSLGEPYCKYPPNWIFRKGSIEGQYDFEPLDAQIADLRRNSPGAKFICMVDLNSPPWLSTKYDSFNQLGCVCADHEWRRVTAKYMRNLLEYLEKRYPDELAAYVLACGGTDEWYDRSGLARSSSRSAAWIKEPATEERTQKGIPSISACRHVSFDNLLRDPEIDGEALHYIKFCAEQIVDTVKFFLREARYIIRPEIELGTFFGYPLCLAGDRVIVGNNSCEKILEAPELDFIISPSSGVFSGIGKGGGDLGPTESVQLHGKQYLRECDQKTHSMNRRLSKRVTINWSTWENEQETIAGIKRELAYTLIKQCSCWWFDMWGGFYDSPAVMELLAKGKEIYDEYITMPVNRIAEIAFIVDTDSIYYLNQDDNTRVSWFYRHTKTVLDLLGAPYECYNFSDIPKIPKPERIKLWVLPGIFEVTPEKWKLLDQYVRCRGQSVLYMYAPGISDGKSLDPERVEQISGSKFGTPGISTVKLHEHLGVYVASGPDLTVHNLKEIAAQAGVHLYCRRQQPIYANSRLLAVHSAEGNTQKVYLSRKSREVRELFTNNLIAKNCEEFYYEFNSPDTALFRW